jgi:tRNA 2-thiouridine synthesizing protein A
MNCCAAAYDLRSSSKPPVGLVSDTSLATYTRSEIYPKGMLVEKRWNAGEIGCSQLVWQLRERISTLKPGDKLEVTARDPAAFIDIAAWCRMTGHDLLSADHPVYMIQRKAD